MSADCLASLALVFVGGRGGAGASSAAALSAAALSGARLPGSIRARPRPKTSLIGDFDNLESVVFCDFDPLGAGADVTLGVETRSGFRWHDFAGLSEAPSSQLLVGALPKVAGFELLAWGEARPEEVWASAHLVLTALTQRQNQTCEADQAACEQTPQPKGVCFVFDVARSQVGQARALLDKTSMRSVWFVVCPTDVPSVHSTAKLKSILPLDIELITRENRSGGVSTQQVAEALLIPATSVHHVEFDSRLDRAMTRGEFVSYCQSRPKLIQRFAGFLAQAGCRWH